MDPLLSTPDHAVQFYGSDESLFSTVGAFLAEGLISGQPALLIATESHRAGILSELERKLIDVRRARSAGNLVVLDANELVELFVVGDMPDAAVFESYMGSALDKLLAGRNATIRAYGEIVDVLWKQGRVEAAIALEILWNKLVGQRKFALLCGYSMGHFYKRTEQMQHVCDHHATVLPADTKVLPFDPTRARTA